MLERIKIFDKGNFKISSVKNLVKKIISRAKIPLMLSYSHLPTYYSFQSFYDSGYKDLKLLVFDAHADLKDEYMDEKIRGYGIKDKNLNDATWLRRLSEKINPKKIAVLGLRSCDEDELNFMKEKGIFYYTSQDIKNNIFGVKNVVREFSRDSEIYLSLDLDVFDPSIAPGVDHPEPNGIYFDQFSEIVRFIAGKIVGLDVCCLKTIKGNNQTEFLAIKSIFEILSKI